MSTYLRQRLEALLVSVVETVHRALPEYPRLPPGDDPVDELTALAAFVVGRFLDLLATDRRALSDDELVEIEQLGARGAVEGASLEGVSDAVLIVVSIGQLQLFEAWAVVAESGDDPRLLRDAVVTLTNVGRGVVRSYQAGFVRRDRELVGSGADVRHRARDRFLRRVLTRPSLGADAELREASAVGLHDFVPPFALVALRQHSVRPDAVLDDQATALARKLPVTALQPVTFADPEYPEFAVVVLPRWHNVRRGEVLTALGNLGREFELLSAFDLAEVIEDLYRVCRGLSAVVPVLELGPAATLGRVIEADHLLRYEMVNGLAPERQGVLLGFTAERPARGGAPKVTAKHLVTLRESLAYGQQEAARRLGIDRGTVRRHVTAIEDATGLSVTEDRFIFEASFILRDLRGDQLEKGS